MRALIRHAAGHDGVGRRGGIGVNTHGRTCTERVMHRRWPLLAAALLWTWQPAFAQATADLVAELTGRTVDDQRVGYALGESPNWATYARLRDSASTEELRDLLHHPDPSVRVYVFWALTHRRGGVHVSDVLEVLQDAAPVMRFAGCQQWEDTVAEAAFAGMGPLEPADQDRVFEYLLTTDLKARLTALNTWQPPERLRPAILARARATGEGLVAVARARREEDVPLLALGLSEGREGLEAVALYPHPDLLPLLRQRHADALATPTAPVLEVGRLYAALAAYGAVAVDALQATLDAELPDELRRVHLRGLHDALAQQVDPAFAPVLFRLWEEHGIVDCSSFDQMVAHDRERALAALGVELGDIHRLALQREACVAHLARAWADGRRHAGHARLVGALADVERADHFRALAAEVARVRAPGAVEVLFDRLRHDRHPWVVLSAARALVAYGGDVEERVQAWARKRRRRDRRAYDEQLRVILSP